MRPITKEEGAARRKIATKYLEVAEIAATEDGAAINVAVGIACLPESQPAMRSVRPLLASGTPVRITRQPSRS